jgi:hypothetical protein
MSGLDSSGFTFRQVAACCEDGDERLCSVKYGEGLVLSEKPFCSVEFS